MKYLFTTLALTLFASSAMAGATPVPEIDGTLGLLMIGLVGGMAILLKKSKD